MTDNMAKPFSCHAPIIAMIARQVRARGIAPPMNRAVSGSGDLLSLIASRGLALRAAGVLVGATLAIGATRAARVVRYVFVEASWSCSEAGPKPEA